MNLPSIFYTIKMSRRSQMLVRLLNAITKNGKQSKLHSKLDQESRKERKKRKLLRKVKEKLILKRFLASDYFIFSA